MQITMHDTLEEMFTAIEEARTAADERVKDWQAEIKVGDHFAQWTEYGFMILGKVLEAFEEPHMKHYRFCFCFSEACPEGERGDVHMSAVTSLIDEPTFKALFQKLNPPDVKCPV